jgi:hypothetical protein
MAQELRSINLVAPGFKGINTEDSPLAQDPSFAEIADNAVIDKRGRIAARKGHVPVTADNTPLGTSPLTVIKEFEDGQGTVEILSAGNNKLFKGTNVLTEITPGSYTITANNWKVVNFNNKAYFFQAGHEPIVYDGTSAVALSSVAGAAGVTGKFGNEVLSAFGRLWVADVNNDKSTIYWSDLLIGHDFAGGTSGSINLDKVWPDGYDEVVSLAAHNGLLIIFGRHSIVVYQGAASPASMTLADTVTGVGCVDRDTVQYTGTDVIFLSHNGLRSFRRVIQEKSMPISSLSKTITTDIISLLQNETDGFRSVYSPEENFYLLTFTGQSTTYCFDLKGTLEDGSYRATRWPGSIFKSYERLQNGKLYLGTTNGISEYTGYLDNGSSYRFKYYSPSLTFGAPERLKFLKKIKPTLLGSNNNIVFIKFAYDFETSYNTTEFLVESNSPALYNINEFGANSSPLSEFTGGEVVTNKKSLNVTGGGSSMVVGIEADIEGNLLSVQEINILALLGKTV